jgi:hypothetical protein
MPSLLTIKKRADFIKKMYDEAPTTNCFNTIVHGPLKVGKTTLLKTAVKPVLIHSFDPGGWQVLRDEIDRGEVLVDTRFEEDNPYKPRAYKIWKDEFATLCQEGFFNHVGTFAIDSVTSWQQVIMYDVIAKAAVKFPKRRVVGSQPFEEDWLPQMQEIENNMRRFLSLPCNCVLLGHSEYQLDREKNIIGDLGLMITGKLRTRIPALFSEIYHLRIKNFRTGERELITQPDYQLMAGTRIGSGGKLEKVEKPDFKHIMRKVGMSTEDKPLFKDLETE